MAKKLIALVACLALIASFVGCGDKEVTFNTEDWKDMEIRVSGYKKLDEDPLNYEFAEGAKQFAEEYGTEISFHVGGGDGLGDDIVAGIMAGDPWELQYVFGISVLPLAFAENIYTPITKFIDFETNDKIDKVTVEGTKWLGEYYGVSTLGMQENVYIMYNETWMKELGLKTPYEYYKEGNWTWEAYKELRSKAVALGAPCANSQRPHITGMYMSEWNEETGEVTVTYDSQKNLEWLTFWGELENTSKYGVDTSGLLGQRECIMRDDVMPNIMKNELTQESTDVIRYIHFPNQDGGIGVYLTDSHFLFPNGVPEDKLACAFNLGCYMVDAKNRLVIDDFVKSNMNEEDYALYKENLENAYFLPRLFYNGVWEMCNKFAQDMKDGKAIATHIAENTEILKARAEEFNSKYVEGWSAK